MLQWSVRNHLGQWILLGRGVKHGETRVRLILWMDLQGNVVFFFNMVLPRPALKSDFVLVHHPWQNDVENLYLSSMRIIPMKLVVQTPANPFAIMFGYHCCSLQLHVCRWISAIFGGTQPFQSVSPNQVKVSKSMQNWWTFPCQLRLQASTGIVNWPT